MVAVSKMFSPPTKVPAVHPTLEGGEAVTVPGAVADSDSG
jgi:hypothetical protein